MIERIPNDEMIRILKEKQQIKDKKRKEIFSNLDYIKWLDKVTLEDKEVNTNYLIYGSNKNKLKPRDEEKVDNLNLFFGGIDEYANKNYIPAIDTKWGCYYPIKAKLNNEYIGFEIGVAIGQGSYFYCTRVDNPSKEAIDFNDIMNNKIQDRTIIIDKEIDLLTEKINKLIELGMPIEYVLNLLKEKNNDNKKAKQKVKK